MVGIVKQPLNLLARSNRMGSLIHPWLKIESGFNIHGSPAAGRYNLAWVSIENLLVDYVCQDHQFQEYVYWTSVSIEHFQTNNKMAAISIGQNLHNSVPLWFYTDYCLVIMTCI